MGQSLLSIYRSVSTGDRSLARGRQVQNDEIRGYCGMGGVAKSSQIERYEADIFRKEIIRFKGHHFVGDNKIKGLYEKTSVDIL